MWNGPLIRIDANRFEIPKEYKGEKGNLNMYVPGLIYASDRMIEQIKKDKAPEQVANVATLPGIVGKSIAMPDLHWGYGFGIGGVAAFDYNNGIISPGGIGFDINCTHPDTKVMLEYGAWKRIKDIKKDFNENRVSLMNDKTKRIESGKIICYLKRSENSHIYEITTSLNYKIRVTSDHPILTDHGMIKAGDLKTGNKVHIYPFIGVEYEKPQGDRIIGRENIEDVLDVLRISNKGNARKQIFNFLERLDLLEIRYNSPKLPILLRIMGFIFGDGVVSFVNKRIGIVSFYGKKQDLEEIKKDIQLLGFSVQNIFSRRRSHSINTYYGNVRFDFNEESLFKKSTAFAALLVALGVPYGKKVAKYYRVPRWLMEAPLWQKRLFLASFFGAELSRPRTLNKYNFCEPQLNMNKLEKLKENGIEFLNDVRHLLSEFGVESSQPVIVKGNQYQGKEGKTIGLRIKINSNPKNLLNLFEKINYIYNREKFNAACAAILYIRKKGEIKKKRAEIREKARKLYESGMQINEIRRQLSTEFANVGFINHSLWTKFKDNPRICLNFISFDDFEKEAGTENGIAWDDIVDIRTIPYMGPVYDITVDHKSHNFIADNFIISNCGVRLLRTNLTVNDIKPKIKEVVDTIFRSIPSGVGAHSKLRVSPQEFDDVLRGGAKWAVEKGLGWSEDIEHLEENGAMKEADPSKVSGKAKQRGMPEIGTLGAGNHFLEVQRVDNIFETETAKRFGIDSVDQIMVMIHTGSRGCGHQICTDYLKILEELMHRMNIRLPDRELAYAPAGSKEAEDYFGAMACGANYAWANRQAITHWVRQSFANILGKTPEEMDMHVIYDVCHNIGKIEEHEYEGRRRKLYVHRKGATRAFGPGRVEIPKAYRDIGQPVLIPGDMGRASYLLVGTEQAMKETFGSTCHGSGRLMSRNEALRKHRGRDVVKALGDIGIYVHAADWRVAAEEAPDAYKNVEDVVDAVHSAGISRKVARMKPLGVVKG